jgi:hypothetical protein
MLLLQLCYMTWLPVKRFFFFVGAACNVVHGQNVKRKERTGKKGKENEKKMEQQPSIFKWPNG